MYVDECRLQRYLSDRGPICKDDRCTFLFSKGKRPAAGIHVISTKGCIGYEGYIMDISLRGPVKNSPFKRTESECDWYT